LDVASKDPLSKVMIVTNKHYCHGNHQIDITKSQFISRPCNDLAIYILNRKIWYFTTRGICRTGLSVADTVVMVIADTVSNERIRFGICTRAHARHEFPAARDRAASPRWPARPAALDWKIFHIFKYRPHEYYQVIHLSISKSN